MRWKIFYTDGSTFSSADGNPSEVAIKPVAIIHTEDGRCGRRVLKLMDWYRFDEEAGRWFDCDAYSILLELARKGRIIALCGQYQTEAEFQEILIASHNDEFVPRISPNEPPHPAWKE